MSPCWMSCQPLGKRSNNKSWTVHPNIAFRREGHRKIQVKDLHLVQMMSQCRATSRKSRHRSLYVAIPNVAGDKSRATRHLSRLTEHKQRKTCVANNVVVAVACRVSRVARNWTRLKFELIIAARHRLSRAFFLKNTDLRNCRYMDYMQESRATAACHVNAIVAQQVALQHVAPQSRCLSRPV